LGFSGAASATSSFINTDTFLILPHPNIRPKRIFTDHTGYLLLMKPMKAHDGAGRGGDWYNTARPRKPVPPGFKMGTDAQLSSVGPAALPSMQDYRSAPRGPILAALNL